MLQKLDTGKANGPDAISAHMLKYTASAIAPSVTELFNLSIRTGQLPKDWKVCHVVPIPKRPGAKSPLELQAHIPTVCSEQSPRKAFSHAHI